MVRLNCIRRVRAGWSGLRGVPARDRDAGEIVIQSGLSVVVRGHRIDLERDEVRRLAVVRVSVLAGHVVTGLEQGEVRAAADMLAERARRFLGAEWTVVPWEPPGRIAGLYSSGSGF